MSTSHHMTLVACIALFVCGPAHAEDTGSTKSDFDAELEALMGDIDIGNNKGGEDLSYQGSLEENAPGFVAGKSVTVTHTAGPVHVRCMDREGLSARLTYTIRGTRRDTMERYGKGLGLQAWGSSSSGGVKTRIPSKGSGISETEIHLTVSLPKEAVVTVNGGRGAVRVDGCVGRVSAKNSRGGAVVDGTFSRVNVSSSAGDVHVRLSDDSVLSSTNRVSANAGYVYMSLPDTYAGRFSASGAEVTVAHMVDGNNSDTQVSGTIGTGSASLTISGKKGVEVKTP